MAELHLELLGRPVVRRPGVPPTPIPISLQTFLAFLSIEPGGACHRDRLIDALWPDVPSDQGRRRLNTAMWRARNLLSGHRDALVASRDGHIAFDQTVMTIDITPTIQALGADGLNAARHGDGPAIDALRHAVLVDVGHFLAGNYDEWVVQTRHMLDVAVMKGVDTLIEFSSASDEAIEWAERLVVLDPLREDAHRRLIRLYAQQGRRADALRQYDVCVRNLRDGMGVEPLLETTLVATAVREGVDPLPTNPPDPHEALGAMRDALNNCQTIVDQIEAAIASLPAD
jgi:DNA-binding SARP family transcriptional activator